MRFAICFVMSFLLLATSAFAQCTVPADQAPCDDAVSIAELTSYIDIWYSCSACAPDLLGAISAYYTALCADDPSCPSQGGFCDGNLAYVCAPGARGCLERVNGSLCAANESCIGGDCLSTVPCSTHAECAFLDRGCGTGMCDPGIGVCRLNYTVGKLCRGKTGGCDMAEYCLQGSAECPPDTNASDGSACEGGVCQQGQCYLYPDAECQDRVSGSSFFEDFGDDGCISYEQDVSVLQGAVAPTLSASGDGADDDLIAHMRFEGFSEGYTTAGAYGNITINEVSSIDNGILGNPAAMAGKYGNALYLNKSAVSIPTGLFTEDLMENGYSYSFWIRPERLGTEWRVDQNVSRRLLASIYSNQIDISNKRIYLYHSWMNGTYNASRMSRATGATNITEGQWHHIAGVYDPYRKEIRVYLDGSLEATATGASSYAGNLNTRVTVSVGNYETEYWNDRAYYTGGIDDFRFYSRPLSSDEVRGIHEQNHVSGSFVSGEIITNGSHNTLEMSLAERNPGSSLVYIYQNGLWHRILGGQELVFDMPRRMPFEKIRYKVVFAANTSLENISFRWSDRQYHPATNNFSFLFFADDQLLDRANYMIRYAYKNFDDLNFIISVSDDGGWGGGRPQILSLYSREWMSNPKYIHGVIPLLFGNGNHDVEVPETMDLTIGRLGPRFPLSVPGMRNFAEGPFDTYPMHGDAEDRYLQYSFDYLNAHFTVVNDYYHDIQTCSDGTCDRFLRGNYSPRGCASDDLLSWLESDINGTDAAFRFLFHHMPLYPSDNRASFSEVPGCAAGSRSRFISLLARLNVTAIFVGHTHMPEFTLVNDTAGHYGSFYEISPGASWGNAAGAVVSVEGNTATIRRYSSNGTSSDLNRYILLSEPLVITAGD